jgi:hypothetical protein
MRGAVQSLLHFGWKKKYRYTPCNKVPLPFNILGRITKNQVNFNQDRKSNLKFTKWGNSRFQGCGSGSALLFETGSGPVFQSKKLDPDPHQSQIQELARLKIKPWRAVDGRKWRHRGSEEGLQTMSNRNSNRICI